MTADEFVDLAVKIVGPRPGWQTRLAAKLGRGQNTISRYSSGHTPVPKIVEITMAELEAKAAKH